MRLLWNVRHILDLLLKWVYQVFTMKSSSRAGELMKSHCISGLDRPLDPIPSISSFANLLATQGVMICRHLIYIHFLHRSSLKRPFPKTDKATLPWTTLCCSITPVVSTHSAVLIAYLLTFTEPEGSVRLNNEKLFSSRKLNRFQVVTED